MDDDGDKFFAVEMVGSVREVYVVRAATAEDAKARWMDGVCDLSEASGMEFYSVKEV